MENIISDNVREVFSRIECAAVRVGRDPGSVTLLAATKNRSPAEVIEAAGAGVGVAGENRVQELLAKYEAVGGVVEWHFIGHLQRNKVKQVLGIVDLIHSVDSVRLAQEIGERAERVGSAQGVLLQVNVAGEATKSGFAPEELQSALKRLTGVGGLRIEGLSTIAPMVKDPEECRWVFRELALIYEAARDREEGARMSVLSMGMTNDFEVAVEEGSTCVRVGTALFGPRDGERVG
jgi:pyridoxal phosphate enzyme (YggS family)